jgi:hypothetical protein
MRIDKKVKAGKHALRAAAGLGKAIVTSDYPEAAAVHAPGALSLMRR